MGTFDTREFLAFCVNSVEQPKPDGKGLLNRKPSFANCCEKDFHQFSLLFFPAP
jgi:hypothetical protein